jgi:hypothetical protein
MAVKLAMLVALLLILKRIHAQGPWNQDLRVANGLCVAQS